MKNVWECSIWHGWTNPRGLSPSLPFFFLILSYLFYHGSCSDPFPLKLPVYSSSQLRHWYVRASREKNKVAYSMHSRPGMRATIWGIWHIYSLAINVFYPFSFTLRRNEYNYLYLFPRIAWYPNTTSNLSVRIAYLYSINPECSGPALSHAAL
jgi:hypothetical protein